MLANQNIFQDTASADAVLSSSKPGPVVAPVINHTLQGIVGRFNSSPVAGGATGGDSFWGTNGNDNAGLSRPSHGLGRENATPTGVSVRDEQGSPDGAGPQVGGNRVCENNRVHERRVVGVEGHENGLVAKGGKQMNKPGLFQSWGEAALAVTIYALVNLMLGAGVVALVVG